MRSATAGNIYSVERVDGLVRSAMATLDVHVDCTESCFDLPEWGELLSRDPNRHIFARSEWNRLWWEEFGAGKDLLLLTMTQGDEVTGIAPLYRKVEKGRKILRWLGGIDLTDYEGPVCSEQDRDVIAATLAGWLVSDSIDWDEFDAHNMPVPLGFTEFLVDHVDRVGLDFRIEQEETTAILTLSPDWDEYLARLSSKDRHELKRKRRRFERDYPDARVRRATKETLEVDLKSFIEMHRGAEGHKGHFMKPEIATFFERIARAFMPLGWLRIDFLEIADTPVASTFGFELDRRFYLYNSAYEPEAARSSPGFVLVTALIESAIHEGIEVFDFLRGPERYKYSLGAEAVPLNNVRVLAAR